MSLPKNENKKKIIFVGVLLGLTVILTIVFQSQNTEFKFIVGKQNILAYYVKTLKPLFVSNRIDKKDVFRFASTGKVPYDNGEKQLVIRSGILGSGLLGQSNFPHESALNSYDGYVKFFKLDSKEQKTLDSILISYQPSLAAGILIGKGSSVAINSDLNKIRTALIFDLRKFTSEIIARRAPEMVKELSALNDSKALKDLRKKVLENISNKFLVYSPDSVFTVRSNFAYDSLVSASEKEREKMLEKLAKNFSLNFHFDSPGGKTPNLITLGKGSNGLSVSFEADTSTAERKLSNALNINFSVRSDSSNVQFNINADTTNGNFNFRIKVNAPDTNFVFGINFNADAISNLITHSIDAANLSDVERDSIRRALDSAMKKLNSKFETDSTLKKNKFMKELFEKMLKIKMRKEK